MGTVMSAVRHFIEETAARALPRILTQICRDQGSPFHGACDRNWWHYKIRDFPSIILQQGGYAVAIAAELPPWSDHAGPLRQIAQASAHFWNRRALLHGAFEEYYPYEQGYPPVAFSTLAVAKLCHAGILHSSEVRDGLAVASAQLLNRFEAQAANQQIAGTAALAVVRAIEPSLVDERSFQGVLERILALQHEEGWFPEYDGPDLGYLAVSIDCLWDIFDHTGDLRVHRAIVRAAEYTAWFALGPMGAAGMHNSRNTDYFVPYGLVRLALEGSEVSPLAAAVVRRLFVRSAAEAFHPFDAVDDRYWSHYIGHSVFRALQLLHRADLPYGTEHSVTPPSQRTGSGHALRCSANGAACLVSTRKGAIATAVWRNGAVANDFGWLVQTSSTLLVSHWWSLDWKINCTAEHPACEGHLVPHKEHASSPWKHIVLRLGSFLLGRRLIRILKRLVIFKKPLASYHFSRSVSWDGETLVIRDRISGLVAEDRISRAPRTSKRHVASADSYHPEDMGLLHGCKCVEKSEIVNDVFTCESRYSHKSLTSNC